MPLLKALTTAAVLWPISTVLADADADYAKALGTIPFERVKGSSGVFVNDGSAAAMDSSFPTCHLAPDQPCNLSSMKRDSSALVVPGGKTRCIFSDSGPYQFEVIPGDTDKLLIFFQGGGACWDHASTKKNLCNTGAYPQGTTDGVFERNNPTNPFQKYTVVHVLYCDGGLHAANVTRPYNDAKGQPVHQVGYENTMSVISWIGAQVRAGEMPSQFKSLIVAGCSAGSIGAQLWADYLLTHLSFASAAVVPDSYVGVFPSMAEKQLIYSFGLCGLPLFDPLPNLRRACVAKNLSLHESTASVIARHPDVVFAQVQSKTDEVQKAFNLAISADPSAGEFPCRPLKDPTCYIDDARFYHTTNDYLETYDVSPNHVHFLVQSSHHCYLPQKAVYTADPAGESSGGRRGETLLSWLSHLPLSPGSGQQIHTRCDGPNVSKTSWRGASYCDAQMAGKIIHAPSPGT